MTQAEIQSYGEPKEQRILKGEARDKTESWREKTRGREKMPKKEISGGRRRRQRKIGLRARKGNMARAQGIAIWGCRGWLPIHSNPIRLICTFTWEFLSPPFPSPSEACPPRSHNLLPRIHESSEHPWALERQLQGKTGKARLRKG